MATEQLRRTQGEQFGREGDQGRGESFRGSEVILAEKYFRRISMFDWDTGKLRGWLFYLTVAMWQVEKGLSR